jgi:hypothetical protein
MLTLQRARSFRFAVSLVVTGSFAGVLALGCADDPTSAGRAVWKLSPELGGADTTTTCQVSALYGDPEE